MIVNALTIAGSDPSGGAGIQADLKTFAALGTYGMSVITALTAQNTRGVRSVRVLDAGFVAEQLDALYEDVKVDTVKIGMVASAGIVEVIADRLRGHPGCNVVLDPVMIAKSGDRLLTEDTIAAMRDRLVPLARLITPNLPEAAALIGGRVPQTHADMVRAVQLLHRLGSDWVLLKGGHLAGADSTDLLFDGQTLTELPGRRIETRNTHGTGCTLSAAIAALLPRLDMVSAARQAKTYLTAALAESGALTVGGGHGPLQSFSCALGERRQRMTLFSEAAWHRTARLREAIHGLPFNTELALGSLSRERFQAYIVQDALYTPFTPGSENPWAR